MTDDSKLQERLTALENEVRELKMGKSTDTETDTKSKKTKKEKPPKAPRAPTAYNKFVSEYISEQKEKLGTEFNHKAAFKAAAAKWKESKEKTETA